MFCLLEALLVQSQYELCYISNKCLFVLEDCVFFILFQVIKPVRGKYQMPLCPFLSLFSSLIKVGTFFSSRAFPKTALCSEWRHCPHFLIQWQRLWESSLLLVVQAKRCKWLYWKSICSCEVLLLSEFFTFVVLYRWELQGGRQLCFSKFETLVFFPVFSTVNIKLKDHVVFYLFTLWKKIYVAFSPFPTTEVAPLRSGATALSVGS